MSATILNFSKRWWTTCTAHDLVCWASLLFCYPVRLSYRIASEAATDPHRFVADLIVCLTLRTALFMSGVAYLLTSAPSVVWNLLVLALGLPFLMIYELTNRTGRAMSRRFSSPSCHRSDRPRPARFSRETPPRRARPPKLTPGTSRETSPPQPEVNALAGDETSMFKPTPAGRALASRLQGRACLSRHKNSASVKPKDKLPGPARKGTALMKLAAMATWFIVDSGCTIISLSPDRLRFNQPERVSSIHGGCRRIAPSNHHDRRSPISCS